MDDRVEAWSLSPTATQLLAVLDTLNAGILVRSEEGRIQFANDRLLQWLGYEADELDGMDFRQLIPQELHPALGDELDEIHSGDERLRIAILKRKDGRTLPIVSCPHVIRDGERIEAVVAVVMDLGEVQTARQVGASRERGIGEHLQRIAHELHTISLFAGSPGVGGIPPDHPDIDLLSPREREILGELLAGSRVPAIAKRLFISPHTVRNHLKSIYRKLDVGDQAELIERLRAIGSREGSVG
jgi:PAS domain S-box-containing protein